MSNTAARALARTYEVYTSAKIGEKTLDVLWEVKIYGPGSPPVAKVHVAVDMESMDELRHDGYTSGATVDEVPQHVIDELQAAVERDAELLGEI